MHQCSLFALQPRLHKTACCLLYDFTKVFSLQTNSFCPPKKNSQKIKLFHFLSVTVKEEIFSFSIFKNSFFLTRKKWKNLSEIEFISQSLKHSLPRLVYNTVVA